MCINFAGIDCFLKTIEFSSIIIQFSNLTNSVGSVQFPSLNDRLTILSFLLDSIIHLIYFISLIYLIYLHYLIYLNSSNYFIINLPTQNPNFGFASGPDYRPFHVNRYKI